MMALASSSLIANARVVRNGDLMNYASPVECCRVHKQFRNSEHDLNFEICNVSTSSIHLYRPGKSHDGIQYTRVSLEDSEKALSKALSYRAQELRPPSKLATSLASLL